MGGFAGAHLMRMVWHCLNARSVLDFGEANKQEAAMHLALRKLPPREVALMAFITAQANQIVPLEQQLQEGMYLEETLQLTSLQSWISNSPDSKAAKATLVALEKFLQS